MSVALLGSADPRRIALSPDEEAQGFVRPLRIVTVHVLCGQATLLAPSDAEALARDPGCYSAVECAHCGANRPVCEFLWAEDASLLG